MVETTSKWSFLHPFAVNLMESEAREGRTISIQDIANRAIDHFHLSIDKDHARKVISMLLLGNLKTEAEPTKLSAPVAEPVRGLSSLHLAEPGTYLVLGCQHVPFNDATLTKATLELASQLNLTGLIFNGDFLDCNTLSNHDVGNFSAIPGMNLLHEYEEGKKVIESYDKAVGNIKHKIYMYGNHEYRFNRYMNNMQHAKTPIPSPEQGLDLHNKGYKVITNFKQGFVKLGDHLEVIHGTYYSTHCAKKHMDVLRGSVLFAHSHRIQSHIEGHQGSFNIGWGGDVNAPAFSYAERPTSSQWQQGFALVDIDEEGDFFVQQIICHNSRFFYNGKKY